MVVSRAGVVMAGVVVGVLAALQALPASALARSQSDTASCAVPSAPSGGKCPSGGGTTGSSVQRTSTTTTATTLIFGSGDEGSTESITDLQQLLDNAGWPTDVSTTLPANLSQYEAIWYLDTTTPLTATEETQLEKFVRAGKGLYLTGERPCCEAMNQSDQSVINALVSGGGVQVGGLGDPDYTYAHEPVNLGAIDGLTRYPNFLSEWTPAAPGGMAGVRGTNVTTTAPDGTPTGAAWDQSEMANGKGRLVIQMDINWLEWSLSDQQADTLFAQNIEYFLMKQKVPALTGSQYVALGDSYASGEGSFSYLAGSNTSSDKCHRAKDGYAEQLSSQFSLSLGFAACSGDIITDLYLSNSATSELKTPASAGYSSERAQFSMLGPNTQLVTISTGGDDVGFADALYDCVSGFTNNGSYGCQGRDQSAIKQNMQYLMTYRPAGCMAYLPNANPGNNTDGFCASEPSLQTVYQDIAELAPNAAIYVIGYPHLFGSTFNKDGNCDIGGVGPVRYTIEGSDVAWINRKADTLDNDIRTAASNAATATGRYITFVDPRATFAGHGVCDTGTPWINPLKIGTTGAKQESFHPNVTGQQALTTLISQTILSIGHY